MRFLLKKSAAAAAAVFLSSVALLLLPLAGCGRGGGESLVTPPPPPPPPTASQRPATTPTSPADGATSEGKKGAMAAAPGRPDVEVRPVDLYSDYGRNEATGDAKYLGKVVQSTASVCQLYKEAGGAYVVAMTAQADLAPCVLWRMHPAVKASDLAHIIAEPTAPPVTIKGFCRGARPSRQTLSGKQVILDGAVLVTAPKR